MGAPPMQRPMRRGTSKAVPVVVSAGLAVGVFCGLLFGVGTGKDEAAAATSASGNNVKTQTEEVAKAEPGAAPKGLGATSAQPVKPAAPAPASGSGAGAAIAAAGSAAGSAGGSAAGSAAPAAEEKKVMKVTFKPKPEAAADDAKISIDGKDIEGLTTEVPLETKSIKVEVTAKGFRTYERKFDIVPGAEMTIEFEMRKKSSGVRPPKRPERPTNAGGAGGGLIDI